MDNIKLSKCLFSDLKTDAQRRDWFLLGRGVETGIIAPALQTHLVNAYSKLVESSKLIEQQQQQIEQLEQRNNELSVMVESLHNALKHLYHNAKASGAEMGLALDVASDTLSTTPQQNLNEVKRHAVIDAIDAHKNNVLTFDFDTAIRVTDLIKYANTKYPSDKEGE